MPIWLKWKNLCSTSLYIRVYFLLSFFFFLSFVWCPNYSFRILFFSILCLFLSLNSNGIIQTTKDVPDSEFKKRQGLRLDIYSQKCSWIPYQFEFLLSKWLQNWQWWTYLSAHHMSPNTFSPEATNVITINIINIGHSGHFFHNN